jgi:hypothetical protein
MLNDSLESLTGSPEYHEETRKEIEWILKLQHKDGWFRNKFSDKGPAVDYHFGYLYVMALLDYVERHPKTDYKKRIEKAVRKFMDFEINHIAGSPFQHRREYTLSNTPLDLPHIWQGYNVHYCTGAYIAAKAYRLWKEPAWLDYAERQVQWVLGRNPLGVCMVVSAGIEHPGVYHHRFVTIKGHEDGIVPGGVVNGINGGKDGDKPNNLPEMARGTSGVTDKWQTNEYWIPNQGWFLSALSELTKARNL